MIVQLASHGFSMQNNYIEMFKGNTSSKQVWFQVTRIGLTVTMVTIFSLISFLQQYEIIFDSRNISWDSFSLFQI